MTTMDRRELLSLRVALARVAQSLGVEHAALRVLHNSFGELCMLAKHQERREPPENPNLLTEEP